MSRRAAGVRGRPAKHHRRAHLVRLAGRERLTDALALLNAPGKRYTGSVYLAGLALDCLLKAKLLDTRPVLATAQPTRLVGDDALVYRLVFVSHNLPAMVDRVLPSVAPRLRAADPRGGDRLIRSLSVVAARWTVDIRYSTEPFTREEALDIVTRVEEVAPWLT